MSASKKTGFAARHIGDLDKFSVAELLKIISVAEIYRGKDERGEALKPLLAGKSVFGVFFEPSTRTSTSFDVATQRLGGKFVNFSVSNSSISKGESLKDTLQTIEMLGADILVLRHRASGMSYAAGKYLSIPVINAGDGQHAHPTQTLSDLVTLKHHFGRIDRLKVAIVGDFVHSRVAHSLAVALIKLGCRVTAVAPSTMLPNPSIRTEMERGERAQLGRVKWETDLERGLKGQDAVMSIRINTERHLGGNTAPPVSVYAQRFAINLAHIKLMADNPLVMHAGPTNPGIDLTHEVLSAPQSGVNQQVKNGTYARMALLAKLVEAK